MEFIFTYFLKVHGTFADALQAFMEIIWLFNLEYDNETTLLVRFFETMMGYEKTATITRTKLLRELRELTGIFFAFSNHGNLVLFQRLLMQMPTTAAFSSNHLIT